MCRFVVYSGPEVLLADLVVYPKHSLINQSFQSKERCEPLNGDGFGVGWYTPNLPGDPGVFVSTKPAWSNRNLHRLSRKVMSPLVFAHVRAASRGLAVNELNCHPFQYRDLIWMHNGRIDRFSKVKRKLRNMLRDDLYNYIQGTTDTEHAFALFLNYLPEDMTNLTPAVLKKAMLSTIGTLNQLTKEAGAEDPSHYNFAVTDGKTIIVTRYTDQADSQAETLYFSRGESYVCEGDCCRVIPPKDKPRAIIIASEPLTSEAKWEPVPVNHVLVIDKDLKIEMEPIH
ncbi:MAG: class II glutamine amidotransferase [Chlamydiales bacterium]|nr:class II glutamine amidotransferase [Chlamydiales bacterium]